MSNRVYQRILDDTMRAVQDGSHISDAWQHEPFIPPMLTTIVSVGEKSGKIADSFNEANRFFKRDVEDMLNTITVLLEPLMVVLLGIGVAIIVAAVLLPIYNLVLII
jgi:type II secretory pathway component PulF